MIRSLNTARQSRLEYLAVALILLQLADVVTTHIVLGAGGVETNPFVDSVGLGWMTFMKFTIAAVLIHCAFGSRLGVKVLTVGCSYYAVVALWNLSVIARMA